MDKMKSIFFVSALLIVLAGSILFSSGLVVVHSIDAQIEKADCTNADKIRVPSKVLGQNLLLVDFKKIESDLKNHFLCISKVEGLRIFPNKVRLLVTGREPAAILILLKDQEATGSALSAEASASANFNFAVQGQVENFVVDDEGVVYASSIEQINVPKVLISGLNLSLGQQIKEKIITNLLKVLERVKSFGIEFHETKVYSNNLLFINAMPRMIFKLDGKIDTQIASLQLILEKAKIDEEILEFIDLRFDKPVVVFAPKKNGQR